MADQCAAADQRAVAELELANGPVQRVVDDEAHIIASRALDAHRAGQGAGKENDVTLREVITEHDAIVPFGIHDGIRSAIDDEQIVLVENVRIIAAAALKNVGALAALKEIVARAAN